MTNSPPVRATVKQAIEELGGSAANARSVIVLTLHSSKGLEFSAVAIAGLFDGELSRERRRKDSRDDVDAVAYRRRVLYVGMTRARRSLLVVCAAHKQRTVLGAFEGRHWSKK